MSLKSRATRAIYAARGAPNRALQKSPAFEMPPSSTGTFVRLAGWVGLLLLSAGCHVDVVRYRLDEPVSREAYEKLEVGSTSLCEAVSELGAPQKVEWKNGDDYLWYLYGDRLSVGLRFRFPPFRSIAGYQHTFLRLSQATEDLDAIQLVFDEEGILRQKSIRLSAWSEQPEYPGRRWRLVVSASAERSALLFGDGGFADYDDIFEPGWCAQGELGYRPVPIVAIVVSGTYRRHGGESLREGADVVKVEDLELYGLEAGFRFALPLRIFLELGDFRRLQRTLLETDPERFGSLRLYLRTTTGATLSDDLPVSVNGAAAGRWYRRSFVLSSSAGAGIEYGWSWGAAFAGVTYRRTGAFRGGDSPLKDDGEAFEALLFGGGLSIAF